MEWFLCGHACVLSRTGIGSADAAWQRATSGQGELEWSWERCARPSSGTFKVELDVGTQKGANRQGCGIG